MADTEEHYDTPWEFKNKAIAAVLGGGVNGNGQPGRSPKATDENFFEDDTISPLLQNSNTNTKKPSPLQAYAIQPSSIQPTPIHYLNEHGTSKPNQNFRVSPQHQSSIRHSPPHLRRFSTTSCESRHNKAIPPANIFNPAFPFQSDRSRLSFERAAKPLFNPITRVTTTSCSPLSPGPSTAQWTRSRTELPLASALAYPLVGQTAYENEPKKTFSGKHGHEFAFQTSHYRKSNTFDEVSMVHEGMERVQAEQLLKPMDVGDFLLRKKNEGNLALSLRSLDGVLHIKLEMRDTLWVLGEGPKFSSISGMLRCYRKNELPVKGAEHVRLKSPLTTAEVALVLQATRKKSQTP